MKQLVSIVILLIGLNGFSQEDEYYMSDKETKGKEWHNERLQKIEKELNQTHYILKYLSPGSKTTQEKVDTIFSKLDRTKDYLYEIKEKHSSLNLYYCYQNIETELIKLEENIYASNSLMTREEAITGFTDAKMGLQEILKQLKACRETFNELDDW